MNIQRFVAATSREALAKARHAFGEGAVILSSRSTDEGFEVMATNEDSLTKIVPPGASRPAAARLSEASSFERPAMPAPEATVEDDTEQMAMSTLSFQDYVRERMLRKRREALQADGEQSLGRDDHALPPRTPNNRLAAPPAPQIQVPVQRFNEPPVRAASMPMAPAPIRTRPVAAAPTAAARAAMPSPSLHGLDMAGSSAKGDQVQVELNALKDMIEERFNTLAWLGSSKQNPIQSGLMLKLIRAGYSPAMARAVLEKLPAEADAGGALRWVMDVLTRNLKAAGSGQTLCEEGGVVSLVGATGVGKTTTAAKLAAQCIQLHGAGSVGLITLDSYRVSGYEQLRTYGRMIGVVAHLAHDRAALKDLLGLLSNKRMVIIDTAGLGQRDQRLQDMLDMLDMPQVKKTLVLNAGSHGDTIDDVLKGFKAQKLHGVILSKVDEAVKLGPALDALVRHQVTLRGVANGQRVPEDWQNPDAAALVRASMATAGKSAYDPVSSDMGLYFGAFGQGGLNGGSLHV